MPMDCRRMFTTPYRWSQNSFSMLTTTTMDRK